MHNWLDATRLARDFGYGGIFLTIFLESGVVFGFFLPGDSLLFAAGLLAAQHKLNIFLVIVLSVTAAIAGNNAGYYTGRTLGHRLFNRKKSFWFSPKRIQEAHNFFEKEGPQSLILARFIPAVRTFVPIVAGMGEMPWRRFYLFNGIGALVWAILLPTLGYTVGKTVHNIDRYLLPVVAIIIMLSAIPIVLSYLRSKK